MMAVNALGTVIFSMSLVIEHNGRFPMAGLGKDNRVFDRIKHAGYKAQGNRREKNDRELFFTLPHYIEPPFISTGMLQAFI